MREAIKPKYKFVATPEQWQAFVETLDRPARSKPELARLFLERQNQNFTTENTEDTK
jgi:uncharacterized protein (DUF1778 family)